jgi:uncharacterized protein (DUF1919 family)
MNNLLAKIKKIPPFVKQNFLNLFYKIQLLRRKSVTKKQIKRLQNKDFTLVANNCNGCVLIHELGLRFNSQFVNLAINPIDYIKYLENFDYYNELDVFFIEDDSVPYPVGMVGDVRIDFVHYKSNEEAKAKWTERKKRLNPQNMFVMFTEQDNCTEEYLKRFDELPFENKVAFTCKEHTGIKSSVFVKKYFGNPKGVYMFLDFENKLSTKRNYDVFDFVSWFNGEKDLSKLMKE